MSTAARDLQTLFDMGVTGALSDGQLLERFVARREEAVFEEIVRRHGPMVWGVCLRVLRDHHDAEDAFQATFLVLARKAASVMPRGKLGNWLYGVAYRTARKARAMRAKRRVRESQVSDMPETMAAPDDHRDDPLPLLDQELSRLSEKYRIPVVLCDLEGRTHQEAASQLGWPIGTVSSRLSRARAKLAQRLTRRGVSLSGGSLAVLLAQQSASASMATRLISSMVRAASLFAAGGAAAGVVPAEVTALAGEVLKNMLMTKLKIATMAVLVGSAIIGGGTGVLAYRAFGSTEHDSPTQRPSPPEGGSGATAGPIRSWAEYFAARSRVSQKAYDQALDSFQAGKVDLEAVHLWSRRLLETQIATATGSYVDDPKSRAIHVASAEAHRDRMKHLEGVIQALVEKGGGSPLSISTAEYFRIEAEALVLEYRGVGRPNK
jgi:RNA polymerase sigma-70 factor (ECF subfamily)